MIIGIEAQRLFRKEKPGKSCLGNFGNGLVSKKKATKNEKQWHVESKYQVSYSPAKQ